MIIFIYMRIHVKENTVKEVNLNCCSSEETVDFFKNILLRLYLVCFFLCLYEQVRMP